MSEKKKVRKGCLVPSLVFIGLIGFGLIFGLMQVIENPEQYSKKSELGKVMELTKEQEDDIVQILNESGIGEIKSVKLFNTGEKKSSYYISTQDVSNVVVWISNDKKLLEIYYNGNDIYVDGNVVSPVTNFYMSQEEKAGLRLIVEKVIKDNLKSPSTAKFAPVREWNYTKDNNVSVVSAYVDSQNGFGATIRTKFQFTFEKDKITSLLIDGVEYIK